MYTEILEPGPFTLYLPSGTKKVYLMGYNDVDNDGPPYRRERDVTFANGSLNLPLIIIDAITQGVVMVPVGQDKTD